MGKRKRINTIETEISFPEPIIQHIQSFLHGKKAAQTRAVSKSWSEAWLTRPDLYFDQLDFSTPRISDSNSERANRFWDFVHNSVQRYEKLNLMVKSFKLRLLRFDSDSQSAAFKLIGKILQLGGVDICLACRDFPREFVLPYEMLVSKTLVSLSLSQLNIYLPPGTKVSSKIESLNLKGVFLGDDQFFHKFPFLEDLVLESCIGLGVLDCPSVKSLTVRSMFIGNNFFSGSYSCLENLALESCHGFVTSSCTTVKVLHLRGMLLSTTTISQFNCLQDLTIQSCSCFNELVISNRSLVTIRILESEYLRARVNVPTLCKFKLWGTYYPSRLPLLSFTTVPKECEFDMSLNIYGSSLKQPWCYKLRRFVKKLSPSKFSLSIKFYNSININDEQLKGKQGPVVENLRLLNPSQFPVDSDVLSGLLWSCRPKFITQDWFPSSSTGNEEETGNEFLKLLCRELILHRKDRQSQYAIMSAYHDLRDVNIEYFDSSIADWRPVRCRTLLNASKRPRTVQKIRFQLEWLGK